MQEEVEEPAHIWFSQHWWHSDCGGPLPGLDCPERVLRRTGMAVTAFLMRPGGDTWSRGLNSTDVSAWDGTPGDTLHALYNLHMVT